MSIIKVHKKSNNFTIIDNTCLNDKNLSWQAKGMLCYLFSLPEDWKISIKDLQNRSTNKRDSTSSTINELIENGYALRSEYREKGKFGYNYDIYETPQNIENINRNGKTVTVKPTRLNRNGKTVTTNNYISKDYEVNNFNTHTPENSDDFKNLSKIQDTKVHAVAPEKIDRKKYHFDAMAIVKDLKELYKTCADCREQLTGYFEKLGIGKEQMNEKYTEFAEKFALHLVKVNKKQFYETHLPTDEFQFYACAMELHNDFLNAFTWLQRVKPNPKIDKTTKANFAPNVEKTPIVHRSTNGRAMMENNDTLRKIQIETNRQGLLTGKVQHITVLGLTELDLTKNYVTGKTESVDTSKVNLDKKGRNQRIVRLSEPLN